MSTRTKYIDKSLFETDPDFYTVIVKLMMACNDIQTANEGLKFWKEHNVQKESHKAYGAKLYFVKLQWSHLYEGLKSIQEIDDNEKLRNAVSRCDKRTQEQFDKLKAYIKGGEKNKDVEKYLGRLRSNFTFHYDESGKLIPRSIGKNNSGFTSITRGSTSHLWRFKAADEFLDDIVVNEVWGVDNGENKSLPEVEDFAEEIHIAFVDFCGEFIWSCVSR